MKTFFQKFICFFLVAFLISEPILMAFPQQAHAEDPTSANYDDASSSDNAYDGDSTDNEAQDDEMSDESKNNDVVIVNAARTKPSGVNAVMDKIIQTSSDEDTKNGMGLTEALSSDINPRIVLNFGDQESLKALYYLSGRTLMPDFDNEPDMMIEKYAKILKKLTQAQIDAINTNKGNNDPSITNAQLVIIKNTDSSLFQAITHAAALVWSDDYGDVRDEIAKNPSDPKNVQAISAITGRSIDSVNEIIGVSKSTGDMTKYKQMMNELDTVVNGLKIDIRVLKTLMYLVTPKSQGGAGHWKIKVKRILNGYSTEKQQYSRESNSIYNELKNAPDTSGTQSAADIGQGRSSNSNSNSNPGNSNTNSVSLDKATDTYVASSDSTTAEDLADRDAFAEITDENGDTFNALVDGAFAQESADNEIQKNISAHAYGEAVDISEIDDIRCTLIKKRRIGGYSRTAMSQRPIKLAWQTQKGYSDSGAATAQALDMANMIKNMAAEGIRDLVEQFGGDVTDYDGDLSKASFEDVATIIGQSIFSQILNSPGSNLKGYDVEQTIRNLGSMYFADFLGLPRDMFTHNHVESLEQVNEAIGTVAVEKRLNLPVGTFDGDNLNEMLGRIGQRKIEFEMNLASGSLDDYFNSKETFEVVTGRAVMEQSLNLKDGSLSIGTPSNYPDLKKAIGPYKAELMFRDSAYVDGTLNLAPGTTELLKNGSLTPLAFITTVGRIRIDNTAYGFSVLGINDIGYGLPEGTFKKIISGNANPATNKANLIEMGIQLMASTFTSTVEEKQAFITWVRANKDKVADDANPDACAIASPVKVTNVTLPKYLKNADGSILYDAENNPKPDTVNPNPPVPEVTISQTKATAAGLREDDLFRLFGCNSSNSHDVFQRIGSGILRYAVIQQSLNPEDKIKLNLTQTDPRYSSSDPDKQFYIDRYYKIPTIIDRIKKNWEAPSTDANYIMMQKTIKDGTKTIGEIFDRSISIGSIDQFKTAGRNMSMSISSLFTDVQALRTGVNGYINKVNATIIDLSELSRTIAEMIEGKAIPASAVTTVNEVNAFSLSNSYQRAETKSMNAMSGSNSGANGSIKRPPMTFGPSTLMILLSGKMKPQDFFFTFAADKVETELELPQNSLIYFVYNYSKKGLNTKDSFYTAVGQAKIEEQLSMPSNYFQGPLLSDYALDKPDFSIDLRALRIWSGQDATADIPRLVARESGPLKAYASEASTGTAKVTVYYKRNTDYNTARAEADNPYKDDGSAKDNLTAGQEKALNEDFLENQLLLAKIKDRSTFKKLVATAEKNFDADMKAFIDSLGVNNKELEMNIADVVDNVNIKKLNDKPRTPEDDVLFRMGITGSYATLTEPNNTLAWLNASVGANRVDKLLDIPQGSTRALISGNKISTEYSKDKLSKREKQQLTAKMEISPTALEQLSRVLNEEIPKEEMDKMATDVTSTGDNPYFKYTPPAGATPEEKCPASLTSATGTMTSPTMMAGYYLYVDADGPHIFGNKGGATTYAVEHENKQLTYTRELAIGISKIAGGSVDDHEKALKAYINGIRDDVLNISDTEYEMIEKAVGVPKSIFDKIFQRSHASEVAKPLVAYKRSVGYATLRKIISSKLFDKVGTKINPDIFNTDDFFELMQGNYQVLWEVAGSMIDRELNIPEGSVFAILSAPSPNLKTCALAEIGGTIVGRYIGLDYVSLKGNIFENYGRAKLEKTLGLSRDSFSGINVYKPGDVSQPGELMKNVGVINFALAFEIAFSTTNTDLNAAINNVLNKFYDPKYVTSIASSDAAFRLKKIKEYMDINTARIFVGEERTAMTALESQLALATNIATNNAVKGGPWVQNPQKINNGFETVGVNRFLNRIGTIDLSFGLAEHTTASMLAELESNQSDTYTMTCLNSENSGKDDGESNDHWDNCQDQDVGEGDEIDVPGYGRVKSPTGTCDCDRGTVMEVNYNFRTIKVTPNDYVKKIAQKATFQIGLMGLIDLFDFDITETQKESITNLLLHFSTWSQDKTTGYANIFSSFSSIFSLQLDQKAGLQENTIKKLIEHPESRVDTLWQEATHRADAKFNIDPSKDWSFTSAYKYFEHKYSASSKPEDIGSDGCTTERKALDDARPRWKAIEDGYYDWIDANGIISSDPSGLYQEGRNQLAVVSQKDPSTVPGYSDWKNKIDLVVREKATLNEALTTCKNTKREDVEVPVGVNEWNLTQGQKSCDDLDDAFGFTKSKCKEKTNMLKSTALNFIINAGSSYISQEIAEYTKNTVIMPAGDVAEFFKRGDLRYFEAATVAYGANLFLDKLNKDQTTAMPPALQINYAMIRQWFVPDRSGENYAANAAAANSMGESMPDMDTTTVMGAPGDLCTDSFFGCFASQEYWISNPSSSGYTSKPPAPAPEQSSITNFMNQNSDRQYGAHDPTATETAINASNQEAHDCSTYQVDTVIHSPGSTGREQVENAYKNNPRMAACDTTINENRDMHDSMQKARESYRTSSRKMVEYRMMDALFWTKDRNVFPGFSQALFAGNAQQKNMALMTYLRNGLRNGELLGKKLPWIQRFEDESGMSIENWGKVIAFAAELSTSKPAGTVLADFAGSGGYEVMSNYIEKYSENWFGFKIEKGYAQGLITGLTLGWSSAKNWGLSFNPDPIKVTNSKGQEVEVPTMGSIVVDGIRAVAAGRIYRWADRQLNWPPGTSQMVYTNAKKIYDGIRMVKTLNSLQKLENTRNTTMNALGIVPGTAEYTNFIQNDPSSLALETKINDNPAAQAIADKSGGYAQAKAVSLKVIGSIISDLIAGEITKMIYRTFGKEIAAFEDKYSIVPGSSAVVIGGLVSYGVAAGLAALFPSCGLFAAAGPAGLIIAGVMFLAMNLFGYYKTEVKCGADGYFPELGSPSPDVDSGSGLGTWDGMDSATNEQMTIAAAKYKSKQLILDVLKMHNSPMYKDIYPSQIMTADEADVKSVNGDIQKELCAAIDPKMASIEGICGGNTMAGVWANPQTTTYTHIGF